MRLLPALPAAFLLCTTPAAAQSPITDMPPALLDEMAAEIRRRGFECPAIRDVFEVGYDHRGQDMRVVCGRSEGPAIPALSFRVSVTSQGTGAVAPW
jgi:hypothetical protein